MNTKIKMVIPDIACYLFVLLFLYTAANKIWKFHNFEWVLGTLPVIGKYHLLLAYAIPSAEIISSVLLLTNSTRKYGLISSFLLMLTFSTYLLFMVFYAKDLPCNCGGVISHLSWGQHIIFNLFFLMLSVIALKFDNDIKGFTLINTHHNDKDIVRAKQAKR
ncbi:MauE/DoxX family redox-associated membrane protein [Pedobacter hartonius]|uniref:Methylamine utilisation protein MauE domain-containing protein n=1 Tax=Pedobacter hartonius TaxID=425514 RepID=A0A1H4BWI6_9SPHI|nr:MauE/DoxX family redox-associated membrane protein [Pedobacter hartonius]SEA52511.1 hypothetical protein SAMN05443550_103497 [Pedobacter hartonius]